MYNTGSADVSSAFTASATELQTLIGYHAVGDVESYQIIRVSEDAACVQRLVILREEDIDVLDVRGSWDEDVGGVLRELTIEDGHVAHYVAYDGC
jgi:hypothetical protein